MSAKLPLTSLLPPPSPSQASFKGGHIRIPRRRATRNAPLALLVLSALASYLLLYRSASTDFSSSSASRLVQSYHTDPFQRPDVPAETYRIAANAPNPAVLVKAKHGAVATEHEACSGTGVDILKAGGNAVDAAIAATLCIGVVSMFSAGLGGGGFMTVRVPNKEGDGFDAWTVDFRETAPASSSANMYVGRHRDAQIGGLAAGVPGEVMGLAEAHRRWAKLPWSTLVKPARDLARGFPVGRELARRLPWFEQLLVHNPDWSPIFAPEGRVLKEGEIMRRTNLSRTLDILGKEGISAFYNGSIAESLVAKAQATGGILTMDDMANYSVLVAPALEGSFAGRRVLTSGAPTSGAALVHMLHLADRLGLAEDGEDLSERDEGERLHLMIECMKFGFAARTRICDPAYTDDLARIALIPTERYADAIYPNITISNTHPAEYYNPSYDVSPDHGTSHISTYSAIDGSAASVTSTVNLLFGSQVLDPTTGIILNDEMDDFSIPGTPNAFGLWPSPWNFPAPGKRPLSSTSPTIIEGPDGNVELVLGGSGGSRIFGAVFLTIMNLVSGASEHIGDAVEKGRVHDQLFPAFVDVDNSLPDDVINLIRQKGHNVSVSDRHGVKAVVNAVHIRDDVVYAASDSRKNGIAAGW